MPYAEIAEQTEEKFLIITEHNIHYARTATEAVKMAGVPNCWAALPIQQVNALQSGDEMSVGSHNSIFRITGRDVTMTYMGKTKLPWSE